MTNEILETEIDTESCIAKTQVSTQGINTWCVMRVQPWSPETLNLYLDFILQYELPELGTWYRLTADDSAIILENIGNTPSKFHRLSENLDWEPDLQKAWGHVRALRTGKLTSCDWTQLPDVPLATKEAWATYRQQLRDITQQPDPFNIAWPVAPG